MCQILVPLFDLGKVGLLEECLLTDAEFEEFKVTTSQLKVPDDVALLQQRKSSDNIHLGRF